MGGVATLAHAAEAGALPVISNPGSHKRCGERLAREMRVAAGGGIGAHVDQEVDLRVLQQRDEGRGAARAVAYRVDQAASASAGFLVFFFAPLFSSPAAGASVLGRSSSVTSASGALS